MRGTRRLDETMVDVAAMLNAMLEEIPADRRADVNKLINSLHSESYVVKEVEDQARAGEIAVKIDDLLLDLVGGASVDVGRTVAGNPTVKIILTVDEADALAQWMGGWMRTEV